MRKVSASDVPRELNRVLDDAEREPVIIERGGRSSSVVVSIEKFEALEKANLAELDALCERVSARARALGITEGNLDEFLREP